MAPMPPTPEPPPAPQPVVPMSAARFRAAWDHPVHAHDRNWTADFEHYRNAFIHLMGLRRPHFARLAVPTYLQSLLVAYFCTVADHHVYVQPAASGERIYMTVWRPAPPAAPGDPPAPPAGGPPRQA